MAKIFKAVKGFKKEDLRAVAEEIGASVPGDVTVSGLKELILQSEEYKNDPDFVEEFFGATVAERVSQEEKRRDDMREEKRLAFELEKAKLELELVRIRVSVPVSNENSSIHENLNPKRKFTLPKLEFRQFGDDLKEWLPFWSQFQNIDQDCEIAAEDKFQYLVQATIPGSRAREVVESFPATGENYSKAVESLKARFGREDLQVEVYVRELLKLIICAQTKEKFPLPTLYDKLECYLRALESLGVTTEKCASILYPMVESCFSEDFLKAWNRNASVLAKTDPKERLNDLMSFLKAEVEGDERINLAMAGFGLKGEDTKVVRKRKTNFENSRDKTPTAATLLTSFQDVKKVCVFCDGKHVSSECFSARKMTLSEKQGLLKQKRCCFACLLPRHTSNKCRVFLKCMICEKKHVPLMCERLDMNKKSPFKEEEKPSEGNVSMSNFNRNPQVFLQTLKAKLNSGGREKIVRLFVPEVADEMRYTPLREEKMIHSLFGGVSSKECVHRCYKIELAKVHGDYRCNFDCFDQASICEKITPVSDGPWLQELQDLGIALTDVSDTCESIQVLIGADVMGRLLSGHTAVLSSGLVAVETYLGWTLMGKVPRRHREDRNLAMTVTSLFVKEADISNLWQLDVIGITDPLTAKSKEEEELKTKMFFQETVRRNKEGRYEVCLPWKEEKVFLKSNKELSLKRLEGTTKKLTSKDMVVSYNAVFSHWNEEGIIQDVIDVASKNGHFLPHRPVLKDYGTTKIRPVFDASAREKGSPSLNQCLESGPNLIELIPDILLRFRELKYAVVADIEKAFLQISLNEKDRDYLKFFWWDLNTENKVKVLRHARVVFGVNCSPFLLGAVIEFHLLKSLQCASYDQQVITKLLRSFYVDNLLASVSTKSELLHFVKEAREIMAEAKFNLRGWDIHMNRVKLERNIGRKRTMMKMTKYLC